MVGVFITARLGSTRLSEKHLIEVKGKPLIKWLVDRFRAEFSNEIIENKLKIIVATSINPENQKFESILDRKEVEIFYGSDENIPLRHLECAEKYDIDHIISIDGDDILCSTEAARIVMKSLLSGARIVQTLGLPIGMNVTGYSCEFLRRSLKGKMDNKLETGWGKIFDKNEMSLIQMRDHFSFQKIRMTLDYKEDADFFNEVILSTDIINITDHSLLSKIIANKWNEINLHLADEYWANFNEKMNE